MYTLGKLEHLVYSKMLDDTLNWLVFVCAVDGHCCSTRQYTQELNVVGRKTAPEKPK